VVVVVELHLFFLSLSLSVEKEEGEEYAQSSAVLLCIAAREKISLGFLNFFVVYFFSRVLPTKKSVRQRITRRR